MKQTNILLVWSIHLKLLRIFTFLHYLRAMYKVIQSKNICYQITPPSFIHFNNAGTIITTESAHPKSSPKSSSTSSTIRFHCHHQRRRHHCRRSSRSYFSFIDGCCWNQSVIFESINLELDMSVVVEEWLMIYQSQYTKIYSSTSNQISSKPGTVK